MREGEREEGVRAAAARAIPSPPAKVWYCRVSGLARMPAGERSSTCSKR